MRSYLRDEQSKFDLVIFVTLNKQQVKMQFGIDNEGTVTACKLEMFLISRIRF